MQEQQMLPTSELSPQPLNTHLTLLTQKWGYTHFSQAKNYPSTFWDAPQMLRWLSYQVNSSPGFMHLACLIIFFQWPHLMSSSCSGVGGSLQYSHACLVLTARSIYLNKAALVSRRLQVGLVLLVPLTTTETKQPFRLGTSRCWHLLIALFEQMYLYILTWEGTLRIGVCSWCYWWFYIVPKK